MDSIQVPPRATSPPGSGAEDAYDTTETAVTRIETEWRPDSSVTCSGTYDSNDKRLNGGSLYSNGGGGAFENRNQPPARASTPTRSDEQKQSYQRKTTNIVRRLSRPPGVVKVDQYMAFAPLNGREKITMNTIQTSTQRRLKERVCRPYSMYSVPKACDKFAIGPYGLPFESGATGRFKQGSLSRSYPGLQTPGHNSLHKANEENLRNSRLHDGLNLINTERPHGTGGVLRRPPDRPFRQIKPMYSVTPEIHRDAYERMSAVHNTLAREQNTKSSPAEYKVAVELVKHLQVQRKENSCFKVPLYLSVKSDIPLPSEMGIEQEPVQMIHYMTKGELSLREGKKANNFDPNNPKKPPTKSVQKNKRAKSPPLSEVTKELFFPEVKLVRDEEKSKRIQYRKGIIAKGLSSNGKAKLIHEDDTESRKSVNELRNSSATGEFDLHLEGVSMDLKFQGSPRGESREQRNGRNFSASANQSLGNKTPSDDDISCAKTTDNENLSDMESERVKDADDKDGSNKNGASGGHDQCSSGNGLLSDESEKPHANETNNNQISMESEIENDNNDGNEATSEIEPSTALGGEDGISKCGTTGDTESDIRQRPVESDISAADDFNVTPEDTSTEKCPEGEETESKAADFINAEDIVPNDEFMESERPNVIVATTVGEVVKDVDIEDPSCPTSIENVESDVTVESGNCEPTDGIATEDAHVCAIGEKAS